MEPPALGVSRLTPFSGNHQDDGHKKQSNRFHCGLPHKDMPTRGGGCRESALLPSGAILPHVEVCVCRFGAVRSTRSAARAVEDVV